MAGGVPRRGTHLSAATSFHRGSNESIHPSGACRDMRKHSFLHYPLLGCVLRFQQHCWEDSKRDPSHQRSCRQPDAFLMCLCSSPDWGYLLSFVSIIMCFSPLAAQNEILKNVNVDRKKLTQTLRRSLTFMMHPQNPETTTC